MRSPCVGDASPCVGDALHPPLWKMPNSKLLSLPLPLPLPLSLCLSLACLLGQQAWSPWIRCLFAHQDWKTFQAPPAPASSPPPGKRAYSSKRTHFSGRKHSGQRAENRDRERQRQRKRERERERDRRRGGVGDKQTQKWEVPRKHAECMSSRAYY